MNHDDEEVQTFLYHLDKESSHIIVRLLLVDSLDKNAQSSLTRTTTAISVNQIIRNALYIDP
jgi:hypothetical protein